MKALKTCKFIKKETLAQVFSCEFCEIFKNTFFIEDLRWLLLFSVCNFIKKRLQHRCFPAKYAKFLKAPFSKNLCDDGFS